MPLGERTHLRRSSQRTLDLPPPFKLVTLREVGGRVFSCRQRRVRSGAGTLVYVGRFDLAEFAVVLEPEEPLETASRALCRHRRARGRWRCTHHPSGPSPSTGPTRCASTVGSSGARGLDGHRMPRSKPPAWLVFGAMIRIVAMGEDEPGLRPLSAALDEEGFENFDSDRLVESFARHLMVAIDTWRERTR